MTKHTMPAAFSLKLTPVREPSHYKGLRKVLRRVLEGRTTALLRRDVLAATPYKRFSKGLRADLSRLLPDGIDYIWDTKDANETYVYFVRLQDLRRTFGGDA